MTTADPTLHPKLATIADAMAYARPFVNSARDEGKSLTVAYVDESGQPVQALRGSTQVLNDRQLCIWLRNAKGGMARALSRNPRVSLLYRSQDARTTLSFQGHARLVDEPALREAVYACAPEYERHLDPQLNGAAVIIDVDRFHALLGKAHGRTATFEVDILADATAGSGVASD